MDLKRTFRNVRGRFRQRFWKACCYRPSRFSEGKASSARSRTSFTACLDPWRAGGPESTSSNGRVCDWKTGFSNQTAIKILSKSHPSVGFGAGLNGKIPLRPTFDTLESRGRRAGFLANPFLFPSLRWRGFLKFHSRSEIDYNDRFPIVVLSSRQTKGQGSK